MLGRYGYLQGKGKGLGHECFNFLRGPSGHWYGYIPPIGENEAAPKPSELSDWLIIFVSAYQGKGRLTVVGWYEGATFAGRYVSRPEYESGAFETDSNGDKFFYCMSAPRAFLIAPEMRTQTIHGDHFRRSPILYVRGRSKDNDPWRQELAQFAEELVARSGESTVPPERKPTVPGIPWIDPEFKRKVETAAVKAASEYVQQKGYHITSHEHLNCGYDLLAVRSRAPRELHIEVKGTYLDGERFFMSGNEKSYIVNPKWRLALVTNALSAPKIQIMDAKEVTARFRFEPLSWIVVPR